MDRSRTIVFCCVAILTGCVAERAYDGPGRSDSEVVTIQGMNPADPLIPSGWASQVKRVDGRDLSGLGAKIEILPGKHVLDIYCSRPGAKPVTQRISIDVEGGSKYGIGVMPGTNDCNVYQMTQGRVEYKYPETVMLSVDQQDRWRWGTERKAGGEAITESVPKGQSLTSWRELITFQYYSNAKRRFTRFGDMNSVSAHLKEKEFVIGFVCPDLTFQILKNEPDDAIYIWSARACKGDKEQFEVARLVRTSSGIHRIAYSKKAPGYTDAERNQWLTAISAAHIVKR